MLRRKGTKKNGEKKKEKGSNNTKHLYTLQLSCCSTLPSLTNALLLPPTKKKKKGEHQFDPDMKRQFSTFPLTGQTTLWPSPWSRQPPPPQLTPHSPRPPTPVLTECRNVACYSEYKKPARTFAARMQTARRTMRK